MALAFQGMLGLIFFMTLAWCFSENRPGIKIVPLIKGLVVSITLATLILKFSPMRTFFHWMGDGVNALREATIAGTSFVFGYLGGGAPPFPVDTPHNMFVFAYQALPMIIFVSALAMLLFHWRVLPMIVKGVSWFFKVTLDLGGALGVCSSAKIFLGQTEAPLLIRPYLKEMSRGEIFTVMTLGLATTSGSILAIYAAILGNSIPDVLTHIISASVINIPSAILLSRIMIPHSHETSGQAVMPYKFSSSMDALSKGTSDGLSLFLNIIAMLIVFIALVALTNIILGCLPYFDGAPITLQRLLGYIMSPVAWLMGIPWVESTQAGSLLGIKTILNEMYAYTELAGVPESNLSDHSRVILTYALCGFANISSIGILIGGIGGIVPEKRQEVISLGYKALLAGTMASCFSGTVVGIIMTLLR